MGRGRYGTARCSSPKRGASSQFPLAPNHAGWCWPPGKDVAEVYFTWDALMAAVFEYAEERRNALFPSGVSVASVME